MENEAQNQEGQTKEEHVRAFAPPSTDQLPPDDNQPSNDNKPECSASDSSDDSEDDFKEQVENQLDFKKRYQEFFSSWEGIINSTAGLPLSFPFPSDLPTPFFPSP